MGFLGWLCKDWQRLIFFVLIGKAFVHAAPQVWLRKPQMIGWDVVFFMVSLD
jgi:hypothetical protein